MSEYDKCVDCMNFLTTVVKKSEIENTPFNFPKILKAVTKKGKARVFWCRRSGAVYLHNFKVFLLKACHEFDDADTITISTTNNTLNIKIRA